MPGKMQRLGEATPPDGINHGQEVERQAIRRHDGVIVAVRISDRVFRPAVAAHVVGEHIQRFRERAQDRRISACRKPVRMAPNKARALAGVRAPPITANAYAAMTYTSITSSTQVSSLPDILNGVTTRTVPS